jgi:hypothetical protein
MSSTQRRKSSVTQVRRWALHPRGATFMGCALPAVSPTRQVSGAEGIGVRD